MNISLVVYLRHLVLQDISPPLPLPPFHFYTVTIALTTNQLLNGGREDDCCATLKRKYYQMARTVIKRAARPQEWHVTSSQSTFQNVVERDLSTMLLQLSSCERIPTFWFLPTSDPPTVAHRVEEHLLYDPPQQERL